MGRADDLLAAYVQPAPAQAAGGRRADELIAAYSPQAQTPVTPAPVPVAPAAEPPGKLEALGRGFLQGGTLRFADELAGVVGKVFTNKTYAQARDEYRASDKAAQQAHGGYFGAGEVGGGLATSLIPGGGLAKVGLTGAKAAAAAAGLTGAAQAVGSSESSNAGELAGEALKGGAIGAALGGVAHKVVGKFVDTAKDRYVKNFVKDITEGATPTAAKRFAGLRDLATDVLDNDKVFMKAAKQSPGTAQKIAEDRLGSLSAKVNPVYEKIDAATGGIPLRAVTDHLDDVIEQTSGKPGLETLGKGLQSMRDNFEKAFIRGGEDPGAVSVPSKDVRQWVTRMLEDSDTSIGSLNDHALYNLNQAKWEAANDFLKGWLTQVEQQAPGLANDISRLRDANRQIAAWAQTKELLKHQEGREFWKRGGLTDALKGAGLPVAAAAAAGAGGLVHGGLAYVGGKAALAAGSAANKAATRATAKLLESAQAGNLTSKAALEAIRAGVPQATVRALMTAPGAASSAMDNE